MEERAAFLEHNCAGDEVLRQEVESLLAKDAASEGPIDRPAWDGAGLLESEPDVLLAEGTNLGPYRITGLLGAGGMGQVYRADDSRLGRSVAIKISRNRFSERFEREARAIAALNHPNICTVHDVGPNYLVMELVQGPTLADRIKKGPVPLQETLDLARQIADALEAAHEAGIVHRDLKPANIKITPGGVVKLLDFGLAKELAGDMKPAAVVVPAAEPVTIVGSVLGTIAYMSPEQARGEPADARADLFSFGAVLYEMVTGQRAFAGTVSPVIFDAILHQTPRSARSVNPAVPSALERIILQLLAKDRTARYQTAAVARDDLEELGRQIESARLAMDTRWQRRGWRLAIGAALMSALVAGGWTWSRFMKGPPASAPEYVQITHFADSATSPALSPDGRMMTFIRGGNTFFGNGQVYVKALPDGEPVPLTRDRLEKMSPVFSPDGSRIAYTTVSGNFGWDTWTVPVPGGEPRQWLTNTAGLTWISDHQVLFSEITQGIHMNLVTASESRDNVRAVYTPGGQLGMAHRSYLSPDGKWVAVVEMEKAVWLSCRVVPIDGSSAGRRVGPDRQCTSAAWSPDGSWLYFSSSASGAFHIWRQRFPDGSPEQITFGPTEEEGIAMAPDGRSFLTSVGNRQRAIWIHDASGEHELSREGYAFVPSLPMGVSQPFSADGRKLFYLVRQGAVRFMGPEERSGELWVTELETARSESLLPGFQVIGYDISRDGSKVAFAALDEAGKSHIWLARVDRKLPPRQLSSVEADTPRFGAGNDIFCRVTEGESRLNFIYRMKSDGSALEKAAATPILFFFSASPDGMWLTAQVGFAPGNSVMAFPVSQAKPVPVCAGCEVDWTADGKSLVVRLALNQASNRARTFLVPLGPREALPPLPPEGIRSEKDLTDLPGSLAADGFLYPNDKFQVYAFRRETIQRNIYRVPLQ